MRVLAVVSLLLCTAAFADEAGGLTWTAPSNWKKGPDRPMRSATYELPSAPSSEPGELAVFYFGKGGGGGVDANVQRWIAQFEKPEAKKTRKEKVNGLEVTRVEVSGTYTASMGPMAPKTDKPDYRLVGAIVEGPEGAVFFKLTGPKKTVAKAAPEFEKLMKTVKAKK